MTANQLHKLITEFVAERSVDSAPRTRARGAAPDDRGPTFTRDLIARMATARSGRNDAPASSDDRELLNGAADTASEPSRPAQLPAPVPLRGIVRFASDLITPVGVVVSSVVVVLALAWMMSESPTAVSGVDVRTADEAAPVDVVASQPQNLFNEAMRSFTLVASGQLGVQVPGETIRDVEKYFAANGVGYSVRFPIKAMPLTGGIVSRYGGRAFAQLVYTSGPQAVYVIEVPTEELRSGKRLYVTEDVLARLEKGERIQEMTPEGESLIMMSDGNLVIAAVGNMEPQQLARMIRAS